MSITAGTAHGGRGVRDRFPRRGTAASAAGLPGTPVTTQEAGPCACSRRGPTVPAGPACRPVRDAPLVPTPPGPAGPFRCLLVRLWPGRLGQRTVGQNRPFPLGLLRGESSAAASVS